MRQELTGHAVDQARGAVPEAGVLSGNLTRLAELELAADLAVGGLNVRNAVEVTRNPATVTMGLLEESLLVDYFRYEPDGVAPVLPDTGRYFAFVLQARRLRFQVVDLGPAGPVEEDALAFRTALERDADDESTAVDRRLRQAVLDPALAAGEESQRLVVCPDDALFTVPLEALPLDDDGGRIVDRYCVSYLFDADPATYLDSRVRLVPGD